MRRDKKKGKRKKFGSQNKLSLFQKPEMKFGRSCPLSQKNSPKVDYKNLKLLKRYTSDSGKILPSRITAISQNKQRQLSTAIKRAKVLGLI